MQNGLYQQELHRAGSCVAERQNGSRIITEDSNVAKISGSITVKGVHVAGMQGSKVVCKTRDELLCIILYTAPHNAQKPGWTYQQMVPIHVSVATIFISSATERRKSIMEKAHYHPKDVFREKQIAQYAPFTPRLIPNPTLTTQYAHHQFSNHCPS